MMYRKSKLEKCFDCFNYALMILLLVITIYPCYYVLVASLSNTAKIYEGSSLLLWPREFTIEAYKQVVSYTPLWIGYANTIFYVVVGTFLSVIVTVMMAYALTRRGLPFKNTIMMCILFTMYFSGGMIPTFLVVKSVGLYDSRWAVILPSLVSTYNLIITMSYFRGLPYELEEAAKIDGANDIQTLWKIFIPIAKPIIAVISLYYMVGIWNSYFKEMIYLISREKFPVQLILREILIAGNTTGVGGGAADAGEAQQYAENLKYTVVVVSTIPILCVYPFIQKYFVKGVTIGAVKG